MLKGKKLYSVLAFKCPRCHEGDLYKNSNMLKLSEIGDMPNNCPVCAQRYHLEPGFYFGAAWMSYTINVLLIVIIAPALYMLAGLTEPLTLVFAVVAIMLLFTPWTFRVSRSIWINFFVSYDPNSYNSNPR